MIAPSLMHVEHTESSTTVPPHISTAPVVDGSAHRLRSLHEVLTRPDFYAAAQRHAKGLWRRLYGFTAGQIAVMGKEASSFFTYGRMAARLL
jgi:hypothetical protein